MAGDLESVEPIASDKEERAHSVTGSLERRPETRSGREISRASGTVKLRRACLSGLGNQVRKRTLSESGPTLRTKDGRPGVRVCAEN